MVTIPLPPPPDAVGGPTEYSHMDLLVYGLLAIQAALTVLWVVLAVSTAF